jgi:hypothetical protein
MPRGYCDRMSSTFLSPGLNPPRPSWRRRLVIQVIRLLVVGLLLGWLYGWAAPLIYSKKIVPGFWLGSAHGALMPMALPALLMGKDVPIYAQDNRGQIYKIGYIAGINACGFVVFGLSFWRPDRRGKS